MNKIDGSLHSIYPRAFDFLFLLNSKNSPSMESDHFTRVNNRMCMVLCYDLAVISYLLHFSKIHSKN